MSSLWIRPTGTCQMFSTCPRVSTSSSSSCASGRLWTPCWGRSGRPASRPSWASGDTATPSGGVGVGPGTAAGSLGARPRGLRWTVCPDWRTGRSCCRWRPCAGKATRSRARDWLKEPNWDREKKDLGVNVYEKLEKKKNKPEKMLCLK